MNSIARFSSRLVFVSHPYDTAETPGSTPARARYHAAFPAAGARLPVAANQAPPGEATNTTGAMHGCGSFPESTTPYALNPRFHPAAEPKAPSRLRSSIA
jgi:hypothetical protein